MAIIPFAATVQDPATGKGIGGVRVRAYPVNADGSRGAAFIETTSTLPTGAWRLEVDTEALPSPTGTYEIELYHPITGQTRHLYPNTAMQIASFVGPHGAAPLPEGSVTTTLLAEGAVTDGKLGPRTLTDTVAPTGSTGHLTTLLSGLAAMIRAIIGGTSWRETPPLSLTDLVAHKSRHAQGGADALMPADIGAAPAVHTHSGADIISGVVPEADKLDGHHANAFALAGHAHPLATDESPGFLSAADKRKLDLLCGSGHPNSFQTVRVGTTDVVADSPADTLVLSAGTGITLTGNSSTDTVVIATANDLNADTVDGKHASAFALASHSHSDYALVGHSHSDYALATHTHTTYAAKSHTHVGTDITSAVASAQDADKLDGYHATSFALRSGTTFTGAVTCDSSLTVNGDLFYTGAPYVYVAKSGSQSIPGSLTDTRVTFNVVKEGGGWNTSASRYTAPGPGTYLVTASVMLNNPGSANRAVLMIYKNGTEALRIFDQTNEANYTQLQGTGMLKLNANDYIEIYVQSGAATSVYTESGGVMNYVQIRKLG